MKPLFTVHEGEFLVGDHINRKLGRRYEVWVPTKDEGIDLLVTRRKGKQRPVRLQVKFSRDFGSKRIPPEKLLARAWFTLRPDKVRKSRADLWVFVVLTLRHDAYFALVPTSELRKRIPKNAGKMWNLYLTVFRPKKCFDFRGAKKDEEQVAVLGRRFDRKRDYSRFLENWRLLAQMSK
jgi:hypothetical protein